MEAKAMPRIDQNPEACEYILKRVMESVLLDIRKSTVPGAGSGLFTAVDLKPGQQIYTSTPLVSTVNGGLEKVVCDNCYRTRVGHLPGIAEDGTLFFDEEGRDEPYIPCPTCRICYYCNDDCLLDAGRDHHKAECKILSSYPTLFDIKYRLLFRLLRMREKDLIEPEEWNTLNFFTTNQTLLREQHRVPAANMAVIREYARSSVTRADVAKTQCVILSNTIPICHVECGHLEGGPQYGRAVDLVASMINHDCSPNATIYFEGEILHVHALKPIQAGSEITISYCAGLLDVVQRRKELLLNHFIDCHCIRCRAETTTDAIPGCLPNFTHTIHVDLIKMIQVLSQVGPVVHPNVVREATDMTDQMKRHMDRMGALSSRIGLFNVVQLHIARCHSMLGSHYSAMQSGLGALLATAGPMRGGPSWCNRMFITFAIIHSAHERIIKRKVEDKPVIETALREDDLRIVLVGWLRELTWLTRTNFGKGVGYTMAVRACYQNWLQKMPQREPAAFVQEFEAAQIRVLDFFQVSEGTEMSKAIALKLSR